MPFFDGDAIVWWAKAFAHALFASFGGAMGYILRSIHTEKAPNFWRTIAEMASSGFVGMLVYLMCIAMKLDPAWTGVIVGVCGWLGASATIAMLETIVRKRLGVEGDKPNGPPRD